MKHLSRAIPVVSLLLVACGPGSGAKSADSVPAQRAVTPEKSMPPGEPPAITKEPTTPTEAREDADKLWQAAEKTPRDPAAWNLAAAALADAAEMAPDSERQLKLLRGALAGWERADSLTPTETKTDPKKMRPLSAREVARINVLGQLVSRIKADDAEVGRLEYARGRIHWRFGHYDRAIPSLEAVVGGFPASPEAEYAAQLLLDSLLLRSDFDRMRKHVAGMLKNPTLLKGRPQLRSSLLKLRHQAEIQQAMELADSKSYTECARRLLSLHARDKDVDGFQGDHLLNNASVCQERAGQIPAAIKTLRMLVRLYPHSAMAAKSRERSEALKAAR